MSQAVIVQTNCGSREAAVTIARAAVDARLAACANVHGPVTSVYRWQGSLEEQTEWVVYLKTVEARLPAIETLLAEQHGYELPCLLVLPITAGEPRYLAWIRTESEATELPPPGDG